MRAFSSFFDSNVKELSRLLPPDEIETVMIHPSTQPPAAALEPDGAPATYAGTYAGTLSRSLGVGGNVLITLSGISPASSVFVLGGAALAAYGTGVFWGFAIAGVISPADRLLLRRTGIAPSRRRW